VCDAEFFKVSGENPNRDGKKWGDGEAEVDAIDEGAMTIFAMAGTEGLRDQGIESNENSFGEKGKDDEETGSDADGADGLGGVGEAPDHHGVDDHHTHPADLGEDEREGEAEGGSKFAAEDGDEGHGQSDRLKAASLKSCKEVRIAQEEGCREMSASKTAQRVGGCQVIRSDPRHG